MEATNEPISREELLNQLIRAAQFRSIVTMLVAIPLAVTALAFVAFLVPRFAFVFFPIYYFGGCGFVSWMLTKYHCRPAVACPRCGTSLWDCGTGNFKPRRMKVRNNVDECPNCRTPIL